MRVAIVLKCVLFVVDIGTANEKCSKNNYVVELTITVNNRKTLLLLLLFYKLHDTLRIKRFIMINAVKYVRRVPPNVTVNDRRPRGLRGTRRST